MGRHHTQRHPGLAIGLVVVGILVAAVVANVAGPLVFEAAGTPPAIVPAGVAAVMMLGFGAVAVVAIDRTGVSLPVRRPSTADLGWTVVTLGGLVGVFVVVGVLLPALGVETPLSSVDLARDAGALRYLAFAVVALLFVGPFEELVFRGFVQTTLESVVSEWGAVAGAALLFGLFHALAAVDGVVVYVVYATAQGVVLGYAYTRAENLVVVALAHGLFDAGLNLLTWARLTGLV